MWGVLAQGQLHCMLDLKFVLGIVLGEEEKLQQYNAVDHPHQRTIPRMLLRN